MKRYLLMLVALIATTGAWAGTTSYDISVGTCDNGKLAFTVGGAEVSAAAEGQTVTITAKPDDVYYLESLAASAYTSWEGALARTRSGSENISVNKDIALTKVDNNTYTFVMPAAKVIVNAVFKQGFKVEVENSGNGEPLSDVFVAISDIDNTAKTVVISNLIVPTAADGKPLAVHIPAQLGEYTVIGVAADVFAGQNVTDVYLPETEKPIAIADNSIPAAAKVHVPLALLDDYALTAALKGNFEAGKIVAATTPVNKFWTFSSGVDIILPAGVKAHTCIIPNGVEVQIIEIPEEQLLINGKRVLKANNGVLIANDNEKGGNTYEIVANPGNQISGRKPATSSLNSYGDNLLEAVVESRHYAAGEYCVLVDNEFHPILDNASMVPACKAVLKKPATAAGARKLNINK